jgi:signal transduction histidine kinase
MEKSTEKSKEDINEFIFIASHQLRTPLTAIGWLLELLQKTEKLSKQGEIYVDRINSSAKRLSNFVEVLLNASRIETGKVILTPTHIDLIKFIKEFLDECTPISTSKNITVAFKDRPDKLELTIDQMALRNIIQSILYNAFDYTSEGGKVEVSISAKDSVVLMSVSDTGIGIPEKDQVNIFDKFTRGSNAGLVKNDGTGLGLFIAQKMIGLVGGKIWFSSKDTGTTFFIEVPIKPKS